MLYDSNNKVIGTETTFTTPSDIEPGQKGPLRLQLVQIKSWVET